MSDLVGNPEDRFSRVAAQITQNVLFIWLCQKSLGDALEVLVMVIRTMENIRIYLFVCLICCQQLW